MQKKNKRRVTPHAQAFDSAVTPSTGLVHALADVVAENIAAALGCRVDIVIHGLVKISREPQKAA